MKVFTLDLQTKKIRLTEKKSLVELGFQEPKDLESWIESAGDLIFNEKILWISRQTPNDEGRSDLIGLNQDGELIVCELKRGRLQEDAITQALRYTAVFSEYTKDQLFGLTNRAADDQLRFESKVHEHFKTHEDSESEGVQINETQKIILVAEDYSSEALSIANYLNNFDVNLECWKCNIFSSENENYKIVFEQILPSIDIREEIEKKRQDRSLRTKIYDDSRRNWASDIQTALSKHVDYLTKRDRGSVYGFHIIFEKTNQDFKLFVESSEVAKLIEEANLEHSKDFTLSGSNPDIISKEVVDQINLWTKNY